MDLAAMTPTEIDTILADIYQRAARDEARLREVLEAIASANYDRTRLTWKGYIGHLTADQALARWGKVNARVAALEALEPGRRAAVQPFRDEAAPYEAERESRPWSRFFLVPDGHIHSSMGCRTCNRGKYATRFTWLPQYSGRTMADMITDLDARGRDRSHILCSVCFPDAPPSWLVRLPDTDRCPGVHPIHDNRRHYGRLGICSECMTWQPVTSTGKVRKHKASIVPADYPIQPIDPFVPHRGERDSRPAGWTKCGTCGLAWDDNITTAITPTPAGHCPFEHFHGGAK